MEACRLAEKDFHLEVIDVSAILGMRASFGDGVYNWLLASGRANWVSTLHSIGTTLISLNERTLTDLFHAALAPRRFDMIVSCCPFLNVCIAEAASTMRPVPPLVTLLSDFENSTDHPWMQDPRQHLICGTDASVVQAVELGHPEGRVHKVSGMVVHPDFYTCLDAPVTDVKSALGLHPHWRTVCIFFGGCAPYFVTDLVRSLMFVVEPLNIVLICGSSLGELTPALKLVLPSKRASTPPDSPNSSTTDIPLAAVAGAPSNKRSLESATRLAREWGTHGDDDCRVHVVGYTQDVPFYMRIADVLVGKPGPGVISEAVVCGVPVVVEVNDAHTPPQEKAVSRWILDTGVGAVLSSFDELPAAITQERVAGYKQAMSRVKNNAVFEAPEILQRILDNRKHPAPGHGQRSTDGGVLAVRGQKAGFRFLCF